MKKRIAALSVSNLILLTAPAYAYIGPGAGIGAIGTLVALVAAVVLILVGFVWYPLKRVLRKRHANTPPSQSEDS